jgi:hypothetical protein
VAASAGSLRYDTDAVLLADPVALLVGGGVVDLVEVVFDAAWDGNQEQLCGLVPGPEPVRAAAGQEHEAACRGIEGVAAAADGQFAAEHIEALIFAVMDMQRRPGSDGGLEDAQGSASGMLRRLQARIARHADARGNDIASREVCHGYIITTVKSHVGNLLAKLGLRDHVQAVILAHETGIVRPGDPDAAS